MNKKIVQIIKLFLEKSALSIAFLASQTALKQQSLDIALKRGTLSVTMADAVLKFIKTHSDGIEYPPELQKLIDAV